MPQDQRVSRIDPGIVAAIVSSSVALLLGGLSLFVVPQRQADAQQKQTLAQERRSVYSEYLAAVNEREADADQFATTEADRVEASIRSGNLPHNVDVWAEDYVDRFMSRHTAGSEVLADYSAKESAVLLVTSPGRVPRAVDMIGFDLRTVELEALVAKVADRHPEVRKALRSAAKGVQPQEPDGQLRESIDSFIDAARSEQGLPDGSTSPIERLAGALSGVLLAVMFAALAFSALSLWRAYRVGLRVQSVRVGPLTIRTPRDPSDEEVDEDDGEVPT